MSELLHPYCDKYRHLVCWPYSIENLHRVAQSLGIHRCWFDPNPKHPHYDIPYRSMRRICKSVTVVDSKTILAIIRGEMPHGIQCPSCKSFELCEPECPVAPWNISGNGT